MSEPSVASLHRRLLWRLLPALFVAIVLGGIAAYFIAKRAADFAYDQALSAAAADVAAGVRIVDRRASFDLSQQSERILRTDVRDDIFFSVRFQDGRFIGGDRDLGQAPSVGVGEGASADLRFRDRLLRAMSLHFTEAGNVFVVTVAETTRKREAAAWTIFGQFMLTLTFVLMMASWIVWYSIRRGLQPLDALQAQIEARSEFDLSPIVSTGTPHEVRSLVHALNRLLVRLAAATRAHQDFVTDAAHQLRTPLAGIQALVEWLATRPESSREIVDRLRFSIDRAVRLVNQLLALARSETRAHVLHEESFDLATLVSQAADSWVHRAIAAQIDLGFDLQPARLRGDPYLIRELLENLVDNAMRHTPPNGQITVATRSLRDAIELLVDDSGPGIPAALRDVVFERFNRPAQDGTGSGLGLAIVRQIASRHQGEVSVDSSMSLGGLRVTTRLPTRFDVRNPSAASHRDG